MKKLIGSLFILFLFGSCIAALGGSSSTSATGTDSTSSASDSSSDSTERSSISFTTPLPPEPEKPDFDIKLDKCIQGEFGTAEARGQLTNQTSRTRSYTIQIEFLDASGNRATDGYAFLNDVRRLPGKRWG